jgi:superoxide dismutase, Fe-Mn family
MNKRQFLKTIGLLPVAAAFMGNRAWAAGDEHFIPTTGDQQPGADGFTLAPLPYATDALEPFIDKQTMEIHHGRHHKAYVDNLNKALATQTSFAGLSLEAILNRLRSKDDAALRNNGGGHWNHAFFWESLSPDKNQTPGEKAKTAIDATFGSFENFKTEFTKAALGRFGSGWAWLCKNKEGRLSILSTPNQDNPLMHRITNTKNAVPVLGIDVWEHAYYLKYQNKRADYVNAFYNIINWRKVEERM